MQQGVDSFFNQLATVEAAYHHTSFAFAAVRANAGFALLKAALFLSPKPSSIPLGSFVSANVRAGHHSLAELGVSARTLVDQFLTGSIDTPDGPVLFLPRRQGGYGAVYEPFHALGLQNQQRFDALMLTGGDRPRFRPQALDWELKAHAEPFYNLADLLAYYDLGQLDQESAAQTVEVIAFGVTEIDKASKVDGDKASIGLAIAKGLEAGKVRLGYRVVPPHGRVTRRSIEGHRLDWEEDDDLLKTEVILDVPPTSIVDCTVSYDGYARNHWWLTDASRAQNPRRAAYEVVDPELAVFSDYITKAGKTPRDQHDFESAVSWLLWMLGFSPVYLGVSKQLETADLVVTTPGGDFAVVECTLGLLKSEHKMARLIERTEAIRAQVDASHHVLPVMVTSKTRKEVRAELPDAEKLGVLVMTRENLNEAIRRTMLMPNADAAYEEAERLVAEAQARHEAQPELELDDEAGRTKN